MLKPISDTDTPHIVSYAYKAIQSTVVLSIGPNHVFLEIFLTDLGKKTAPSGISVGSHPGSKGDKGRGHI